MRVTKEELSVLYPTNNNVLLRPIQDVSTIQTKSGVLLFTDTTYKPEHHAKVICEVVSVPKQLIFSRKYPEYSMEWLCSMELRAGDKVIINYLSSLNAKEYFNVNCDGEKYYFVPYERIYMVINDQEPRLLNGYVLVEKLKREKKSKTLEEFNKIDQADFEAVVHHLGEPNIEYAQKEVEYDDNIVHKGDKVILSFKNFKRLEDPLHRIFDPDRELLVVQRKQIDAILKPQTLFTETQ